MQIFDLSVAKSNKLLLVEGEAFCPLLVGLASITLLVLWMAGFGRFVIGEQSITPSSGPGLDALCCSRRSTITSFSPIAFTLRLRLTFCQQIQIHVMVMVAVIYTSTVLSFTKSLSCSHIIRAVVDIVVTSIIET